MSKSRKAPAGEVLIHGDEALLTGLDMAISMEPDKAPAVDPTTGTVVNYNILNAGLKVAYWGEDNSFPNLIRDLLGNDAEMKALIKFCCKAAFGKGIVCLNQVDIDENGNPKYEAVKDPDINAWYKSRMVRKYCQEAFLDLFTFANAWPEMIVSKDRTIIPYVGVNEAMHTRWMCMGPDGKLVQVVHNKNFPYCNLTDTTQTTFITAIDPYDLYLVDRVRNDKGLKKFVFPLIDPSIGATYYQITDWDGLRVSGWLQIAAQIPAFKTALLQNQMTIKYLVEIPNTFWPSVYKDWDKFSETQKKEKKKEKIQEINKALTDVKNTGKSILNEVGIDPVTKLPIPGWKISVIDDKTKAGAFLEDSAEASAHKLRALGLDPTLVGSLHTGKSMGAGAGSDKQLAWNIYLALIDTYRESVLDPLNFKAQYDGITNKYPGFCLKFRDSIMETVNGHNQSKTEGLT